MIFVCSMTDLFGAFVPDAMIDRVFAVMALASKHTLQVLTKRPERMRAYLSDPMLPGRIARVVLDMAIADPRLLGRDQWPVRSIGDIAAPDDVTVDLPLPNVWLGTSVEDQPAANLRIPDLLATPAAKRFLSCEPLLAKVDLQMIDLAVVEAREQEPSGLSHVNSLTGLHVDSEGTVDGVLGSPDPRIDWVIAGGESGPRARPMHPDWVRSLRDQCAEDGVPYFFKQWGMFAPAAASLPVLASDDEGYEGPQIAWPDGTIGGGHERENGGPGTRLARLSKKLAGRLLDGVTHDGMPA
jgi:protein gp37